MADPTVAVEVAAPSTVAAVRAEQAGALLRLPQLVGGARAYAEGRLSADSLRTLEDLAVIDSLRHQQAAGLGVFTDGQFRRRPGADSTQGAGSPAAEAAFLRTHAPGPFKIAVPCPSARALADLPAGESDLAALDRRLEARSRAVAAELWGAVEEGARYLQLDADRYCRFLDPDVRAAWRARGIEPTRLLTLAVQADAACIDRLRRDDVTVAVRLCRHALGEERVVRPHGRPLASVLLESLPYDRVLADLDPDDPPALDVLRFVPPGRSVALGLVGTDLGTIPTYSQLMTCIEVATHAVPLEGLAISTVSRAVYGRPRSPHGRDTEQRALELVGRAARDVWG